MKILSVKARQILDSRGNPTVETEITTDSGMFRASVPAGASKGKHEAKELRDGGKYYNGMGVLKAVKNVNTIIAKKLNSAETEQADNLLEELDRNKLGANSILSASMACHKATGEPLYKHISKLTHNNPLIPVPFFNIINGGKHAGNMLNIQEFMIVPQAKTFTEALQMAAETYQALKEIIHKKYGPQGTNVGDEGGFAPPCRTAREALMLLDQAVKKSGHKDKIKYAMDCAASEYYKNGKYLFERKILETTSLLNEYVALVHDFNIISVEDPFQQDDFEAFKEAREVLGVQIVGDDLLVTNTERIQKAITYQSCDALLLKINQIGLVKDALEAAKLAKKAGWNTMVSHRSGETNDDFIADLATGLGCGQLKAGAPCRGERLAKYNQLLRLEEQGVKYARNIN